MKYYIVILLLVISFSCGSDGGKKNETSEKVINLDTLMEMNRNLIRKDKEVILEYIQSSGSKMTETGTGLFYRRVRDEDGQNANAGDRVSFNYSITSLTGKVIYSSKEDGLKEFVVDGSDIESGWNEAAKLMSKGDSLVAILPPHLAFRNIGDGNKIGPGQILMYTLHLDAIIQIK